MPLNLMQLQTSENANFHYIVSILFAIIYDIDMIIVVI